MYDKKEKQISIFELFQFQNELEFYKQSHTIATTLLNIQVQEDQTSSQYHIHILFIAYASAFEICTRKLYSRKFQPDRLLHVIRSVDFLIVNISSLYKEKFRWLITVEKKRIMIAINGYFDEVRFMDNDDDEF
ncbi:unnamed protein product [Adineta steineri]|uniref:Uncharacterized protein n=1 Tax=Adineta steineri TaxID=433720 RepID=A0A815FSB6_9BILA|nr:unnamed protein product [Adineta steineri]CAF1477728.1 unnamed protein product [Adineta steineri]